MPIEFTIGMKELPNLSLNTTEKDKAIKMLEDYTQQLKQLPGNTCMVIGAIKAVSFTNR